MDWYLMVWQKFADFNGRARRKEYWMFTLFNCIVFMVLCIAAVALGKAGLLFYALCGLYWLAVIIPSLAVGVRRLHDIGMSGWLLLLGFIPLANFVLVVMMFLDSKPGANQYGPNPKGIGSPVAAG